MTDRCTCHDVLIVKNLNRWFKEKWVDVSRKDKDGKHPPCGRGKASKSSKGYPKCRPSVKVSSKTPKTSGSMSEGQKQAATKRKRAKKQGVGGKPTVVKAMKDEKKGKKGMVMVIAVTAKPKKVGVKKKKTKGKGQLSGHYVGSLFIGDEYDVPLTFDDEFSNTVIKSLSQHPKFQPKDVPLKSVAVLPSKPQISKGFADNGDGWFESQYGTDANTIIRMCRKMRRHDKMFKSEYDSIIGDIRKVKAMEVDTTIKSLTWSEGMEDVIRNIGLSDRSLKALRKFGESRSTSLQKACQQYLKAITVLQHLNDKLDWNTDDQQNWVDANDMKKDAQKMWRNTLHQVDNLTKHEIQALNYASDILEKKVH